MKEKNSIHGGNFSSRTNRLGQKTEERHALHMHTIQAKLFFSCNISNYDNFMQPSTFSFHSAPLFAGDLGIRNSFSRFHLLLMKGNNSGEAFLRLEG